MCGGFIGQLFHNPAKAVTTGVKNIVHNPENAVLPVQTRQSAFWHNVGRPVEKVAGAAAIGALTGGVGDVGLAGLGTLSTSGAIAGGLTSAMNGGFNNHPFSFMKNGVLPGIAGYAVGSSNPGKVFDESVHQGLPVGTTLTNTMHAAETLPFWGSGAGYFSNAGKMLSDASMLSMLRGGFGGSGGGSGPYPYMTSSPGMTGSGGVSPVVAMMPSMQGNGSNPMGGAGANNDSMSAFGAVQGVR